MHGPLTRSCEWFCEKIWSFTEMEKFRSLWGGGWESTGWYFLLCILSYMTHGNLSHCLAPSLLASYDLDSISHLGLMQISRSIVFSEVLYSCGNQIVFSVSNVAQHVMWHGGILRDPKGLARHRGMKEGVPLMERGVGSRACRVFLSTTGSELQGHNQNYNQN